MPGKYLQQKPQMGSTDTVPAMLTPGEFVIRKDAADEIGRDKLHVLNNIDRLSGMAAITNYKPPQFQEGGEVKKKSIKGLRQIKYSPLTYEDSDEGRTYYSQGMFQVPASEVGEGEGLRYYLSPEVATKMRDAESNIDMLVRLAAKSKIENAPQDSIRAKDMKKILKKFQEGGEVMNYFGGGMVKDARARYQEGGLVGKGVGLAKDMFKHAFMPGMVIAENLSEYFGEKSKDADDLSMMARLQLIKKAQLPAAPRVGPKSSPYPVDPHDINEMFKEIMREREPEREYQGPPIPLHLDLGEPAGLPMKPAPDVAWEERPTTGLQQGGPVPPMQQRGLPPAGFMQEGGEVEQPMPTGEPAGMEESPVPQGERTYAEQPMDQLGMEPHEYASYIDNGPDVYKYLAPKYKQQTQWTPYDAMVDAGIINPYEKDKDDFVIIAREQANALRAA